MRYRLPLVALLFGGCAETPLVQSTTDGAGETGSSTDAATPDPGTSTSAGSGAEPTTTTATPTTAGSDTTAADTGGPPPEPDYRILYCGAGGGNVVMLDLEQGDEHEVVWEWRPEDAPGLPDNLVGSFTSMSDCKAAEDGTLVALAGRNDVALVEYPSGNVLVHGPVGAAHSVAVLPGERIIGAGSTAALLRLFEVGRSGEILWEDTMPSAHAVMWDRDRERVYAIGVQSMRVYALADWETDSPRLVLDESIELPDRGAHDLSPIPGSDELVITTRANVWRFDRETKQFAPFEPIADERAVKSVDINPVTGRVSYSQGEGSFWSTRITLLNPDGMVPLPGDERLYKARWFARETAAGL